MGQVAGLKLPKKVPILGERDNAFETAAWLSLVVETANVKELSRELGSAQTKVRGLGSSSGRSRCPPVLQRFPSEDAERFAGNKIALNAEGIVDGGLNGQEALR